MSFFSTGIGKDDDSNSAYYGTFDLDYPKKLTTEEAADYIASLLRTRDDAREILKQVHLKIL